MWDLRIFFRRGVNEIHARRDLFVPEHPVIAAMERWGEPTRPARRQWRIENGEWRIPRRWDVPKGVATKPSPLGEGGTAVRRDG